MVKKRKQKVSEVEELEESELEPKQGEIKGD